jgi:hypothetical protein
MEMVGGSVRRKRRSRLGLFFRVCEHVGWLEIKYRLGKEIILKVTKITIIAI